MGASAWHHVVEYRPDTRVAFAELQKTVLADGNYYHGLGTFSSMAALDEARDTDRFWEGGTHSILDMMFLSGPEGPGGSAVLRVLRDDEVRALFGHDHPTESDFERFTGQSWDIDRWEGRATVLYQGGQPHRLAFWGISGD